MQLGCYSALTARGLRRSDTKPTDTVPAVRARVTRRAAAAAEAHRTTHGVGATGPLVAEVRIARAVVVVDCVAFAASASANGGAGLARVAIVGIVVDEDPAVVLDAAADLQHSDLAAVQGAAGRWWAGGSPSTARRSAAATGCSPSAPANSSRASARSPSAAGGSPGAAARAPGTTCGSTGTRAAARARGRPTGCNAGDAAAAGCKPSPTAAATRDGSGAST